MNKGIFTARVGGIQRKFRVSLKLACAIEDETGRGVLKLCEDFLSHNSRIVDTAIVLRLALAEIGNNYDHDEVIDLIERDGVSQSLVTAANILGALFEKPKTAPGKKSKGTAQPATTSQSETS